MPGASALGGALPVTPFDLLAIFAAAWLAPPSDDAGRVPSSEREGKRL